LKEIQQTWRSKGCCIIVGDSIPSLCNFWFADDIILVGTSRQQLQTMLQNLIASGHGTGLRIHWGKTKILNNIPDAERTHCGFKISECDLEMLGFTEATMYLGRALTFGSW